MVIFTKYSNERDLRFRIRTQITEEGKERLVRKTAAAPEAAGHLAGIYRRYELLRKDLEGTGLTPNPCRKEGEALCFPYREGRTMEQRLDGLLAKGRTEELEAEIERYFGRFSGQGANGKDPGCGIPFSETEEFIEVFGCVNLPAGQKCRAVSDIDMIFANVVETDAGPELIDYEWTFEFPVPVKYLQYRCLHYYIYGNDARRALTGRNLYERFGISAREQEEFARMERHFQSWMLGGYTPLWKLYDDISEGVIETAPLAARESAEKKRRIVEVYFDDGRGFGVWNMCRFRVEEGSASLQIPLPEGTHTLRIDPYGGPCLVRLNGLTQNGRPLSFTSNGMEARNGDLIFDTEDPQFLCTVTENAPVCIDFLAQPLTGLAREQILNQYGRISWMEQTKAWRMYRRAKKMLGSDADVR